MKLKILILSFLALILSGCEMHRWHWFLDMRNSPAIDTQGSDTIGNRKGNMLPPEGSVAYKETPYYLEKLDLDKVNQSGIKAPADYDLERGKDRYEIYCGVCHGKTGLGDGPISKKWATIKPLVSTPEREAFSETYTVEQIYHIATVGVNTMSGYASQVPEEDRWHIARYVKEVLQKK